MSFSLKVIVCLQSGPWIFWKLQTGPFSSTSGQLLCSAPPACRSAAHRSGPPPQRHLLPACLLYSSGRRRCAAPPAALGRPEATSCSRWPPTRRARAAAALLPLALELPCSATHLEPHAGRHLAAVVAGSLQHPRTPTRACTSTQSTTSFYSTLSFTASSPPDSKTPPAITIAAAEQGLAVEPPP